MAPKASSGSSAAIARRQGLKRRGVPWHAGSRSGVAGKEDYDAVLMTLSSARRRDLLDVVPQRAVARFQHASDRPWPRRKGDELGPNREGLLLHANQARARRRAAVRGPPAGFSRARSMATRSMRMSGSAPTGRCSRARADTLTAITRCGRCTRRGDKPVNGPLLYWNEAIHRPGAAQMQYVRA